MLFWGLGVVQGAIPAVNIIKRIAQKLRIIILLHLGLETFRFIIGKQKIIIVMVSGPGERNHDSQNQCHYLWSRQDTSNNLKRSNVFVGKY